MQVQSVRDPSYLTGLEARFALAARHSRRVRFLRIAIPGVIGVALFAVLFLSIFNPFRLLTNLPIDIGKIVVQGTTITMESPHMAGFTSEKRPYELWARSARQDVTDPTTIGLETIKAKIEMEDKTIVDMDARRGAFNNKTQMLHLQEKIFLKSSTGYEAVLTDAFVDLDKGSVRSDQPVAVKLLNGNLDSQNLEIVDNGALVNFGGGVSMDLVLDNDGATTTQSSAASTKTSSPPAKTVTKR